ncbi:hypothetical protein Dimus_013465 [Dionaea muscipula]
MEIEATRARQRDESAERVAEEARRACDAEVASKTEIEASLKEEVRQANHTVRRWDDDRIVYLKRDLSYFNSNLAKAQGDMWNRGTDIAALERDLEYDSSFLEEEKKKADEDFLKSEAFDDLVYREARPAEFSDIGITPDGSSFSRTDHPDSPNVALDLWPPPIGEEGKLIPSTSSNLTLTAANRSFTPPLPADDPPVDEPTARDEVVDIEKLG